MDGVRVLEVVVSEAKASIFFAFSQLIVDIVDIILETIDCAVADAEIVVRKFEVL